MLSRRRQSIDSTSQSGNRVDLANGGGAESPRNEEGGAAKAKGRIAESRRTSFAANFVADRRRHNRGHREIVGRKPASELQNCPDSAADNGA